LRPARRIDDRKAALLSRHEIEVVVLEHSPGDAVKLERHLAGEDVRRDFDAVVFPARRQMRLGQVQETFTD